MVYEDWKKLDSALVYHKKSLELHIEINSVIGMIRSYSNLGEAYLLQKDYGKAIANFSEAKVQSEASEKKWSLDHIYDKLAEVYLLTNELDSATLYLDKSLKHNIEKNEYFGLRTTYANLSKLEKKRGNYKKALEYFELHKEIQDSLLKTQKDKELAEVQAKYDTEKQEKEIIRTLKFIN